MNEKVVEWTDILTSSLFSDEGQKSALTDEEWRKGWKTIVGGINGIPTYQQFNTLGYILDKKISLLSANTKLCTITHAVGEYPIGRLLLVEYAAGVQGAGEGPAGGTELVEVPLKLVHQEQGITDIYVPKEVAEIGEIEEITQVDAATYYIVFKDSIKTLVLTLIDEVAATQGTVSNEININIAAFERLLKEQHVYTKQTLTTEITNLNSELNASNKEISDLNTGLANSNTELENLNDKLTTSNEKIIELTTELTDTKTLLETLKKDYDASKKSLSDGKKYVASCITQKGVATKETDTFTVMGKNVLAIASSGGGGGRTVPKITTRINEANVLGVEASKNNLPFSAAGTAIVYRDEIHFISSTAHYKLSGDTWSTVSTLPQSHSDQSVAVFNDEIHVFYRYVYAGLYNTNFHYKWTSETGWVEDVLLTDNSSGGTCITLDDGIHVLNSSTHLLFTGTEWKTLAPTYVSMYAEVNGIIYGVSTVDSYEIVDVKTYNPTTNSWSSTTTSSTYRFPNTCRAIGLNGSLLVFGGDDTNQKAFRWGYKKFEAIGATTSGFKSGHLVVLKNEVHVLGGTGYETRHNYFRRSLSMFKLKSAKIYTDGIVIVNGTEIRKTGNTVIISRNLFVNVQIRSASYITVTAKDDVSLLYLEETTQGEVYLPKGVKVDDVETTSAGFIKLTEPCNLG